MVHGKLTLCSLSHTLPQLQRLIYTQRIYYECHRGWFVSPLTHTP